MNIIIVGCGKVGFTIAQHLSNEKHDLVIIDKKADSFEKIIESIDVMTLKGNALNSKILTEANVKEADLIISVTNSDETNILCCITAKKLGAKHTIARVRDPEYAFDLYRFKNTLEIDMIINPEQQAALEISRLIRFPHAQEIETFAGGRVEMVSFVVGDGDFFDGKEVKKIFSKAKPSILLTTLKHDSKTSIPHGDTVLQSGDILRVIGKLSDLSEFLKKTGVYQEKVKDVMLIGGGKISYYLVSHLAKQHIKIKILEIDKNKCEFLNENLPDTMVIHGDGTDEEVLTSENISESGAVITLTDRDEENVVIALYAKACGVPKTIAKINHINLSLVKNINMGSVVCPKNITANQIIRYVRGINNSIDASNIKVMYKIENSNDESVEALEFVIKPDSKCISKPIKELPLKKDILIGCIIRSGNIIIPSGDTVINKDDNVILIAKNENIFDFDQILK